MKTHYKTCYERTKYIFPGGFYKSKATIFERLESIGIYVPKNMRHYPYFFGLGYGSYVEKICG